MPAELFSALANDTRLRCVLLLIEEGELCVCEITQTLGIAQPNVSRHLAHLREAKLVSGRREGLWIHYRIHPDLPDWTLAVLRETARGMRGAAPYTQDRKTLAELPNRPGAPRCS